MRRFCIAAASASAFAINGCATMCDGSQETCGGGAGVLAGLGLAAVAANNIDDPTTAGLVGLAAIIGSAFVGQQLGRYLDERDAELAQQAAVEALNSRDGTASWESSANEGVSGTVSTTVLEGPRDCRMAQHLIVRDGRQHQVETQFCRNDDGSWEAATA